MLVSIIIPTLNEETGIKKTLLSIAKTKIYELGYELEILVIDGNSIDSTRSIAKQMGAEVIVEKRKGYGRAYKTGLVAAKGDIIVTLDADGTYPAELISQYIQQLNAKDLDFITINRFSDVEKGAIDLKNMIGNRILTTAMRLLYSIDIKDSQSGMWIMKREFATSINIRSDDMAMSEEIKIIAFKFFKSVELDGKYYKRIGEVKLKPFQHGWKNLMHLFRYKRLLKFAVIHPDNEIMFPNLETNSRDTL